MSTLSCLSVYVTAASLILLLAAVCDAQYDDYTPSPDYDSNQSFTFDYSFFSNTSSDDFDKFSEPYIDREEEEEEEDTGGQQEEDKEVTVTMATTGGQQEEDKEATVTMATTRGHRRTTEQSKVDVRSAASLPVSLEIRMLLWTVMILISLNTPQLLHTL